MCQIFASTVTYLLSTAVMICGQFDILMCSLRNLKFTAMHMNGHFEQELRF